MADSVVSNQTGGDSTRSRRSQSSQNECTAENQANVKRSCEMLSSAHQTPKGNYHSISRQLNPSNSSIPPSSVADEKSSKYEEEDDYNSIWAEISNKLNDSHINTQGNQ